jgi:hypothetical protein
MKKREERRERKKRKKKGINFHKIKERVVFTPRDNGKKTTIRKGATRDERVNQRKREREREREKLSDQNLCLFVYYVVKIPTCYNTPVLLFLLLLLFSSIILIIINIIIIIIIITWLE